MRHLPKTIPRLLLLWSVVLAFGGMALAGCARGRTEIAPPDIRYGEDVCAACNMIISDPHFAAGYAVELKPGRYDSLAFDDIGDMLSHQAATEQPIVAWYVHDYATEGWLDATAAHYVVSPEIATPMGHGVAAFASAQAATELAADAGGRVLTWSELRTEFGATGELSHHHD